MEVIGTAAAMAAAAGATSAAFFGAGLGFSEYAKLPTA